MERVLVSGKKVRAVDIENLGPRVPKSKVLETKGN